MGYASQEGDLHLVARIHNIPCTTEAAELLAWNEKGLEHVMDATILQDFIVH